MNRREFIYLTALSSLTFTSFAYADENQKLDAWRMTTVDEVIKAFYGNQKIIKEEQKITLNAPHIASNSGAIPIHIKSDIETKKILVLQDSTTFSLIGVFDVPKDALVDYMIKTRTESSKMNIVIVLESKDGQIYRTEKSILVAMGGGCEG